MTALLCNNNNNNNNKKAVRWLDMIISPYLENTITVKHERALTRYFSVFIVT